MTMASMEAQLLQKCVDMVNVALNENLKPKICVKIGNNFSFKFTADNSANAQDIYYQLVVIYN